MKRSPRTCLAGLLVCALVTGCAHTVKVSYSSRSETHLELDQPFAVWNGERVKIDWTPSLHAESYKYLVKCDRIWLANSIHERGLRHEYKIAGKGTPLVVYDHNPGSTPQEKHYPSSGIVLGIRTGSVVERISHAISGNFESLFRSSEHARWSNQPLFTGAKPLVRPPRRLTDQGPVSQHHWPPRRRRQTRRLGWSCRL